MIPWLWAVAGAADPTMEALQAELARGAAELSLPDAAGPYLLQAIVEEGVGLFARARLGAPLGEADLGRSRGGGVVVRVGSPTLDQTNFEGWSDGSGRLDLVLDDDRNALRHDLWLEIDAQYKDAVEALAAKTAARERRAEPVEVPSFAPGPAAVHDGAGPGSWPEPDRAALQARVNALSARFGDHPAIELSDALISVRSGRRVIADTGGTRVTTPVREASLQVRARVRAADGATQVDRVAHLARTPEELPSDEALAAEVDALIARLEAWPDLPRLEEEYVGPVLFEGDAAIDLVRWLLLPAVVGTPPVEKPPSGSRVVVWDDRAEPGPIRLKRRVLPSGWTVIDDPGADPSLPGAYTHDFEGVPAERVELVRDGVVRAHLMSRTPSRTQDRSNGHGRSAADDPQRAAPGVVTVRAPRRSSERQLHRQALKVAQDYDLDHYVVIRRLRDPSLEGRFSGGAWVTGRQWFGFDDGGGLPPPVEVVRVHADGREQPIRGVELPRVDLGALKEIVASGQERTRSFAWGEWSPVPVTLTAPDLLLAEVELAPSTAPAEKPSSVPSPLAAGR